MKDENGRGKTKDIREWKRKAFGVRAIWSFSNL
jgi:hypothetical protein